MTDVIAFSRDRAACYNFASSRTEVVSPDVGGAFSPDVVPSWYPALREEIRAMEAELPIAASNSLHMLACVRAVGLAPRSVRKVDDDCISMLFLRGDDQATIDSYETSEEQDDAVAIGIRLGRATPPDVRCFRTPLPATDLKRTIEYLKSKF